MSGQQKAVKKGKGVGRKLRYQVYKQQNRASVNKLKKIARHKKKHPNDLQTIGTVPNYKSKKIGLHYIRDGTVYVFKNGWRALNHASSM